MKIEKRLQVIALQSQINELSSSRFPTAEEATLLSKKVAELEAIRPTPPEYPARNVDLGCQRSEIEEDIERRTRKAQPILDQIARETDPARKAVLEFHERVALLRESQDRLRRWDLVRAYNIWRGEQQENHGAN
jgi:hypothetical protein